MNRRIALSAATATLVLLPASGAFAADGSAPLKVHGHQSANSQLAFPLPDGWRNDLPGTWLNRGVYGREIGVGNATCRMMIVTRAETNATGVQRANGRVAVRVNGGTASFKPLEHQAGWYRSSTTVDPTVTPIGWKATGAGELDVAEDPIVVLAQASAVASGATTDAERARCATVARGEIARGLRTILGGASIEPR